VRNVIMKFMVATVNPRRRNLEISFKWNFNPHPFFIFYYFCIMSVSYMIRKVLPVVISPRTLFAGVFPMAHRTFCPSFCFCCFRISRGIIPLKNIEFFPEILFVLFVARVNSWILLYSFFTVTVFSLFLKDQSLYQYCNSSPLTSTFGFITTSFSIHKPIESAFSTHIDFVFSKD